MEGAIRVSRIRIMVRIDRTDRTEAALSDPVRSVSRTWLDDWDLASHFKSLLSIVSKP